MNWRARTIALVAGSFLTVSLSGQELPARPLSIPVFHPMVLNPAFVGSKDFTHLSLTSQVLKSPDNQILNLHRRALKKEGGYSSLGYGAYIFQHQKRASWNAGGAFALSYHYALDQQHIHNLAAGITAKGIAMVPKTGMESVADSAESLFRPNMDLGIYYYGPSAFAGLSATTLFDNAGSIDSLTAAYGTLNRQYHLYGGYKFLISKKLGIVIEPSLLVSLDDDKFSEFQKYLIPYLKVYLQNFYLGTYLKDFDVFALFFQYQFPRLHTGVFLEFPRVGFLNDDNIIVELSLGVNLGKSGSKFLQYRHW